MTGIYLITNLINNKVYVGQSTDIERRWSEHLRSAQPEKYSIRSARDSKTPIHLAMQKYGINNFTLQILEQCQRSELDDKEQYWIDYYHSTEKDIGYNITNGGQKNLALHGEQHSQAKLTQQNVNDIKHLIKTTNLTLTEIQKQFPFISKATLSMINQGKIWKQDNEIYPLRILPLGSQGIKNPQSKFTEKQVIEIRQLYSQGVPLKDIKKKYQNVASEASINNIVYNKTYCHLPKWDYKNKMWI